jgi:alpha/beta superfamily hydrolase
VSVSPESRIAVVGFSFGAWVGLDVGEHDPAVSALVGIAPPVRMFDFQFLRSTSKPTLIVYAETDQYTPAETLRNWLASAGPHVKSVYVPEVDHFFGPQVDNVAIKVTEFVNTVL